MYVPSHIQLSVTIKLWQPIQAIVVYAPCLLGSTKSEIAEIADVLGLARTF